MVERVARAICITRDQDPDELTGYTSDSGRGAGHDVRRWETYQGDAVDIIKAIHTHIAATVPRRAMIHSRKAFARDRVAFANYSDGRAECYDEIMKILATALPHAGITISGDGSGEHVFMACRSGDNT